MPADASPPPLGLGAAACADLSEEALRTHVLELHRLRAQVEGALVAATGAFDARTAWAADGARSAAGWLAARVDLGRGRAQAEVTLGRTLRATPLVEAASLAGDQGRVKVDLLRAVRTPEVEEVFAEQEQFLVDTVAGLTVRDGLVLMLGAIASASALWAVWLIVG